MSQNKQLRDKGKPSGRSERNAKNGMQSTVELDTTERMQASTTDRITTNK